MSVSSRKLASRYLKACSDPDAPFRIYRLWKLLDDIDTASDIAKADDGLFRALVEQYQRQRFDVVGEPEIDTLYDRYDVAPPLHTAAEAEMSRQNDPYYRAVRVVLGRMQQAADAKYKGKKEVTNAEGEKVTIYQYSERQVANRHREKSERLDKLQSNIGDLEAKLKKDLKSDDLETQLTALAVALIHHTYERVGNEDSAADGHFGVTGWRKKHISFSGGNAKLTYVGKSGVKQNKSVTDPDLVKALKDLCKDKAGDDPLFDCDDCTVTSKEVNAYLKPFDITAKDLRGYHANREMMERLGDIRADGPDLPRDRKERDKILKAEFDKALKATAEAVGHEASTLRSQYLVPHLEETYMKDGSVIESLRKKKASLRTASDALARFVQATKTRAEREDEQVKDKLVRRSPKVKPPRDDLRDHRIDTDTDPDMDSQGQEGDRDLSLNYKRVAARWLRKAEGGKAPSREEQAAGTVVTTESGRLRAKNKTDSVKYFDKGDSEQAKSFAEGSERDFSSDDIYAHPISKSLQPLATFVSDWDGKDTARLQEMAKAISAKHPETKEAVQEFTESLKEIADKSDRPDSRKDAVYREAYPAFSRSLTNLIVKDIRNQKDEGEAGNKEPNSAKPAPVEPKPEPQAPAPAKPEPAAAAPEPPKSVAPAAPEPPKPAAPAKAPADKVDDAATKADADAEEAEAEQVEATLSDLGVAADRYAELTKGTKIPAGQEAEFARTLATKFKALRDNPEVNEVVLQMRGPVNPKDTPAAQAEQLAINHYADEYLLNPARVSGGFAKKGPIPDKELREYGAKAYTEMSKLTPAEIGVVLSKAQKMLDEADPNKADTPAIQQARKMMAAGYLAYLKGGGDPNGKDLPEGAKGVKDSLPENVGKLAQKMGDRAPEIMNLIDGDLLDSRTSKAVTDTFKSMTPEESAAYWKGSKTMPYMAAAYASLSSLSGPELEREKAKLDQLAANVEILATLSAKQALRDKASAQPKAKTRRNEPAPETAKDVDAYTTEVLNDVVSEDSLKRFLAAIEQGKEPAHPAAEAYPKAADRLETLRKQLVAEGAYPKAPSIRRLDEVVNVLRASAKSGYYDIAESLRRVGPPPQQERPRKVSDADADANVELEGRKAGEIWETHRGTDLSKQYGALSKDGEHYDYFGSKEDAQAWVQST